MNFAFLQLWENRFPETALGWSSSEAQGGVNSQRSCQVTAVPGQLLSALHMLLKHERGCDGEIFLCLLQVTVILF